MSIISTNKIVTYKSCDIVIYKSRWCDISFRIEDTHKEKSLELQKLFKSSVMAVKY